MIAPIHKRLLGPSMLLLEWPQEIHEMHHHAILNYQRVIERQLSDFIIECFPAYTSLGISFNPEIISAERLIERIDNLSIIPDDTNPTTWEIPVYYSLSGDTDLDFIASNINLSAEEIIARHSDPIYTVYFFGFLPGFMYLGGLDQSLTVPRKSIPDKTVRAGSVAIGGNQTGIYPTASPGGWHTIGQCPLTFFDPEIDPPCFINPGDQVKFTAISQEEHTEITEEIKARNYQIKRLNHG